MGDKEIFKDGIAYVTDHLRLMEQATSALETFCQEVYLKDKAIDNAINIFNHHYEAAKKLEKKYSHDPISKKYKTNFDAKRLRMTKLIEDNKKTG